MRPRFPVGAKFAERSPLGRHSKSARVKLPSGAAVAAAPAIAGVAAVFCLTPTASAEAVPADAAGPSIPAASTGSANTAAMDTAAANTAETGHAITFGEADANAAGIAAAKRAATRSASVSALPATYRVRPGDSLSSIAAILYHDRAAWPVLYWRNRQRIDWADNIHAGQLLQVPPKPARIPAAPTALGPAPVAGTTSVPVSSAGASAAYTGGIPGGAFGACVVARESGGNAQIMNATGHYGLYQFSAATWAAYGGNPADFGHASVAEQNRVFANALAAGGQSNWAPYDGC